jgi:hypothetical protein
MTNRPEDSAPARGSVVELIGPLIDDRGALVRTLGETATAEGVLLRPGALDQVGGGAVAWALATLLEGHGRPDLAERAGILATRVMREWGGIARSGLPRPAAGSLEAWPRLRGAGPVLVLFGGEVTVARALLDGTGLGGDVRLEIDGDGGSGLPRPDALRHWMLRHGLEPGHVRAMVRSPAAILAATAAACGEVVLVGPESEATALLPVTGSRPDLASAAEPP